jgi:5'-nucleotidase
MLSKKFIRPQRGIIIILFVVVLSWVFVNAAVYAAAGQQSGKLKCKVVNTNITKAKPQKPNIKVQILGINDFHGQLNVSRKVDNKDVGRADYLAAYLKQREAQNRNTLLISAGDLVGASTPVSALLQDEPTVEIMNKIGLDVATAGNHEFDEGVNEMMRLIKGGRHPVTGKFTGSKFSYALANVVDKKCGRPILPPYQIKNIQGVPIGFIGVALSDTPGIVIPSGVAGVTFTDEVKAINKYISELKKKGVKAIIVIAHVPGEQKNEVITGEIADLANGVDDEVDVIIAGHNHGYLNGIVDNKLIVESYANGTAFSDVDLEISPVTKEIVSKKAEIVTTYQTGIEPDKQITKMITNYEAKVAPIINKVIGTAAKDITRTQNDSGESELGNLIVDSQRAEMKTDLSFMNPGGIRTDIQAGEVNWGELFNVQPFNNTLVKMTMTGYQIRTLLNQQWQEKTTRMLQISGLKYTWDDTKLKGSNVVDIFLTNGQPVDPAAKYTVTVNSFLADGGDDFKVLIEGTDRVTGPVDLDALVNYIKSMNQPFTANIEGRITKVN